jgi:hypothetical protein
MPNAIQLVLPHSLDLYSQHTEGTQKLNVHYRSDKSQHVRSPSWAREAIVVLIKHHTSIGSLQVLECRRMSPFRDRNQTFRAFLRVSAILTSLRRSCEKSFLRLLYDEEAVSLRTLTLGTMMWYRFHGHARLLSPHSKGRSHQTAELQGNKYVRCTRK